MLSIILGGVSGVGKTTVGRFLQISYPRDVVFCSIGDFLRDEAAFLNLPVNSIPLLQRKEISRTRFRSEKEKAKNLSAKLFILDSHFAIPIKDGGYEYPFGESVKNDFDLMVILVANEDIVLKRRELDASRNRELNAERIRLDQNAIVNRAKELSLITGTPCFFINNEDIQITSEKMMQLHVKLSEINK